MDAILDKETLTTAEAAKLLGCHPETIRRLVDSGRLPGWRLPWSQARRIPATAVLKIRNGRHLHPLKEATEPAAESIIP